jgi:hypothetical protein
MYVYNYRIFDMYRRPVVSRCGFVRWPWRMATR